MRYVLFILFVIFHSKCVAQNTVNALITLPSVALIDLLSSSSNNFTLPVAAPTEAGNAVTMTATNASNWLVMTSAVATGTTRSIKGSVTGTLPPGIRLKLVVSPYAVSGQGFTGGNGVVSGNLYLMAASASFIDSIKGGYTGVTPNADGYKLTYSLEVQTYSSIRSGTYNMTVTYTMTDN